MIGPPNSGKSYQLLKIYLALQELKKKMFLVDLEDKLEATMIGLKVPVPKDLYIPLTWEEYRETVDDILTKAKEGDWIGVDRVDLTWPMDQRSFSQQKYKKELADRLLEKSKALTKPSMFTPRFDKGDWQPINEAYDSTMLKLLYRSRCNIVMTAGIRGIEDDNPLDVFGHLGVAPRGQKELAHQPHSAFLLHLKVQNKELSWLISTGKDLPGRELFDSNLLFDIWLQYLNQFVT